jgi:hypothetical protein
MNRRTTVLLTGMALLGLAFGALPQFASGQQSDAMLGTPAYADEEATECPVISTGADSDTTEFQLPDGSECYIGHDEPIVQFSPARRIQPAI